MRNALFKGPGNYNAVIRHHFFILEVPSILKRGIEDYLQKKRNWSWPSAANDAAITSH